MKKLIIILLFIIIMPTLFCNEIALTYKTKGQIQLIRNEKKEKIQAGEILYNNDKLLSGEESYAAIKFIDGSGFIKLFPKSILILQGNKQKSKLQKVSLLKKGNLLSKIVSKMGPYEVQTPTTIASVKGTKFYVQIEENNKTTLYTLEGNVNLKNKEDGKSNDVPAGKKGVSHGKGEIVISSFDTEELPENVRDQIEGDIIELNFKNENDDTKTFEIEIE